VEQEQAAFPRRPGQALNRPRIVGYVFQHVHAYNQVEEFRRLIPFFFSQKRYLVHTAAGRPGTPGGENASVDVDAHRAGRRPARGRQQRVPALSATEVQDGRGSAVSAIG
jgi:hypothetical protein